MLRLASCAAAAGPLLAVSPGLAEPLPAHPALHWEPAGENKVRCLLCPRRCVVADRERGTCGVRENRGGKYVTLVHSRVAALNVDPIEKKPLFHYRPGTKAFSMATAGCNIECRFCQNWELSQFRPEQVRSKELTPGHVVREAKRAGASSIAFTYSEPVIFYEYMRDICTAAADTDLGRVMISNGYIEERPLLELLPHLDAVKIDFKAFSQGFYKDVCSADLKPVLDTLVRIRDKGVWLEMVMLVIPTLNDSPRQLEAMSRWIVQKLGPEVPIHFTRFHPMYKIKNLPPTPVATLENARRIARQQGIAHAYTGNLPGHAGENTYCASCAGVLIERDGYEIKSNNITDGRCPSCRHPITGVWGARRSLRGKP